MMIALDRDGFVALAYTVWAIALGGLVVWTLAEHTLARAALRRVNRASTMFGERSGS